MSSTLVGLNIVRLTSAGGDGGGHSLNHKKAEGNHDNHSHAMEFCAGRPESSKSERLNFPAWQEDRTSFPRRTQREHQTARSAARIRQVTSSFVTWAHCRHLKFESKLLAVWCALWPRPGRAESSTPDGTRATIRRHWCAPSSWIPCLNATPACTTRLLSRRYL
jgi:hypothetical protein